MVTRPVRPRAVPLDETLKVTLPLPVKLVAKSMLIQSFVFCALHKHPSAVVTATTPVAPEGPKSALEEESENPHPTPFCVTVNRRPAIVTRPVRLPKREFVDNAKVMSALPVPLVLDVSVIQSFVFSVFQGQPA